MRNKWNKKYYLKVCSETHYIIIFHIRNEKQPKKQEIIFESVYWDTLSTSYQLYTWSQASIMWVTKWKGAC